MEEIIRMGNETDVGNWEYLGSIVQNGVEFIALQPRDGTSRGCFFLCKEGAYLRLVDAEVELALSRRLRQATMEEARGRFREV